MWHAGLGDGRIRVIEDSNAPDGDVEARTDRLRASAEGLGGMIIMESGKSIFAGPTSRTPAAEIMTRIKRQLDPRGILAPIVRQAW